MLLYNTLYYILSLCRAFWYL